MKLKRNLIIGAIVLAIVIAAGVYLTTGITKSSDPVTATPVGEPLPEMTLKRAELGNIDLGTLLSSAGAIPVHQSDGTTLKGFRFTNMRDDSFFRKFGLQSGDVMLSVNNLDATRGMEIYQSILTAEEAKIKIERDGAERLILVKFVD